MLDEGGLDGVVREGLISFVWLIESDNLPVTSLVAPKLLSAEAPSLTFDVKLVSNGLDVQVDKYVDDAKCIAIFVDNKGAVNEFLAKSSRDERCRCKALCSVVELLLIWDSRLMFSCVLLGTLDPKRLSNGLPVSLRSGGVADEERGIATETEWVMEICTRLNNELPVRSRPEGIVVEDSEGVRKMVDSWVAELQAASTEAVVADREKAESSWNVECVIKPFSLPRKYSSSLYGMVKRDYGERKLRTSLKPFHKTKTAEVVVV